MPSYFIISSPTPIGRYIISPFFLSHHISSYHLQPPLAVISYPHFFYPIIFHHIKNPHDMTYWPTICF
jgi:hypothetical protein